MKTKELLTEVLNNNITVLSKLNQLNNIKVIKICDYYDGMLSGIVEVNNYLYYAIWICFANNDSFFYPRRYVVLDTSDYSYKSFEELMNRDLNIIGYFYDF